VTAREMFSEALSQPVVDTAAAWAAAAAIPDPELPVVTIGGLGILRDVTVDDRGRAHVQLTPTYSGCPAMEMIRTQVIDALTAAGCLQVDVEFVLAPAWSTDQITEEARAALAAAGIAPPPARRADGIVEVALAPACPRCGSHRTRELSRFGATSCKALWRCEACHEPFEQVKELR
jgi:ring-1,2-phenylacetyl-CoA epoxidase subunit PaaD